MKLRSGFVSNSSTSSFVLLGAKVKELDVVAAVIAIDPSCAEDLTDSDYPGDAAYEWLSDGVKDWVLYGEENYFGVSLGDASDYEISRISLGKLEESIAKVKKVFAELGIKEEPQLLSGARYC